MRPFKAWKGSDSARRSVFKQVLSAPDAKQYGRPWPSQRYGNGFTPPRLVEREGISTPKRETEGGELPCVFRAVAFFGNPLHSRPLSTA